MTFQSIVSDWCRIYKPMLHNPEKGNKRFFLVDSWEAVRGWGGDVPTKFSPCVVMESAVEGDMDNGKMYRNYPVYFCCRARDMADGDAAAEAKEEAWYHAQNFLTWLREKHNEDSPNGDFGRIEMEHGISVSTAGPLQDGWYGVLIQLTRLELLNLCTKEEMYVDGE